MFRKVILYIRELSDYIDIVAVPHEAFLNIKSKGKMFIPLSLYLFILLLLSFFIIDIYRNLSYNIYFNSGLFYDSIPPIVEKTILLWAILVVGSKLISIFFRWFLFSFVIWLINRTLLSQYKFKKIILTVICSEIILILMEIFNISFIYLRGMDSIQTYSDIFLIPGIQNISPSVSNNFHLFTALSSYNIFSIWYILTVAIGINVMFEIPRIKAFLSILLCWNIWILLSIIRPYLEKLLSLGFN